MNNLSLNDWLLSLNLRVSNVKDLATVKVKIDELSFEYTETFRVDSTEIHKKIEVAVQENDLELWWPNGLGDQKLYNLSIELIIENVTVEKVKSIGFRSVELIQDPVPGQSKGLTFYFKINRYPIFLKGIYAYF